MIRYTHNGGPITIDVHPDDKMIYAQWHVGDFLDGVQEMKPDAVGIYSIILSLIYKSMGQLKDNDRWIAGHCKCDIRYYRKLRDALIASGKIFEADGYLYNNRAMAEIAKFCEMQRRKREAAVAREKRKKEEAETGRAVVDETDALRAYQAHDARAVRAPYARPARLVGAQQDPDAHLTRTRNEEKANEINGDNTTAVVQQCQSDTTDTARLSTEIEIETEIEKKDTPYCPPSPTASVAVGAAKTTQLRLVEVNDTDAVSSPVRPVKTRRMGSRLSEDWKLPQSWGRWAIENFVISADDVRREADKFRDYWVAKSGSAAVKLDWNATWRNWIRNKNLTERVNGRFDGPLQHPDLELLAVPEDPWADVSRQQRALNDD